MATRRWLRAAATPSIPSTPYIETHEYLDSVRNRASATVRRYIVQARRSSGPRVRLLRAEGPRGAHIPAFSHYAPDSGGVTPATPWAGSISTYNVYPYRC